MFDSQAQARDFLSQFGGWYLCSYPFYLRTLCVLVIVESAYDDAGDERRFSKMPEVDDDFFCLRQLFRSS